MNYLRTLVSGKKKRFVDRKYNLDLSYITPRLIAMAYPGSGIETVYRNSIDQVSKFVKERHKGNYLVINLSGKKYDYNKFDNKVLEYDWVDHHAPPLKILFTICNEIHNFLKENPDNVVAINCRAGKGRTGSIICCYLLFSKRFTDPDDVFEYYSRKRFNAGEGVTQPSQKRYVYYFAQLLKEKIYFPLIRNIKAISMNKFPSKSSDTIKPFFEIYLGNGDKISYTNKVGYLDQKKIFSNNADLITITDSNFGLSVSGDLTVKIYNNTMISSKKLGRVSFNTAFLQTDQTTLVFTLSEIDPDNLAKKKKFDKDFEIHIKFGIPCPCQNREMPFNLCVNCSNLLAGEITDWKEINSILENNFYSSNEDSKVLLFGQEEDDVEQTLTEEVGDPEIRKKYSIIYVPSILEYIDDGEGENVEPVVSSPKKKKKDKDDEMNTSFENECLIY